MRHTLYNMSITICIVLIHKRQSSNDTEQLEQIVYIIRNESKLAGQTNYRWLVKRIVIGLIKVILTA